LHVQGDGDGHLIGELMRVSPFARAETSVSLAGTSGAAGAAVSPGMNRLCRCQTDQNAMVLPGSAACAPV
jgi:hypothetical protein